MPTLTDSKVPFFSPSDVHEHAARFSPQRAADARQYHAIADFRKTLFGHGVALHAH
jgi:hypothetical protein